MLYAALGHTTGVMAAMVNAALGVVWPPRRLAWVEVALFFVGLPEPILEALGEAGPTPPSASGFRDRGGSPPDRVVTSGQVRSRRGARCRYASNFRLHP